MMDIKIMRLGGSAPVWPRSVFWGWGRGHWRDRHLRLLAGRPDPATPQPAALFL